VRFSGKGGAAVSFNGSESSPQTEANAQDREAWEVGSYREPGWTLGSSPGGGQFGRAWGGITSMIGDGDWDLGFERNVITLPLL